MSFSGLSAIVSTAADAWQPRPPVSTADFVTENIRLADGVEGSAGPYSLDDNPFWREILDAVHDPFVESIATLKSTQVGGTLANIVAALATSEIDPAPSMFVVPTQDDGRLLRDRLYGNAECSSAILANKLPPTRLRNMISVDLESMHIYLAWPRSKQRMRGKPCKYVWLSEIDVYDFDDKAGDPNNAAERRTDRFPESTIVRESTPVGDDSSIANYFEAGDMRRWHCKCPHCGRYQSLKFFTEKKGKHKGRGGIVGYLDDDGNPVDQETAIKQAHYVCIDGCKIEQPYKAAFIRSGIWVPEGCRVTKAGKITGTPLRSPRIRSYHLWQILNPEKTFGNLAATYLHHRSEQTMREFFQDVLGLRFRTTRSMPAWHVIGKRLQWPNVRGQVPADAWFLTAGADVQEDRVYYSVRGWAPHRTSWLVDWGEFHREKIQVEKMEGHEDFGLLPESDLLQLDQLFDKLYPTIGSQPNPLGLTQLPIRLLGLDSNYRTTDVHNYCLSHPQNRPSGRLRAIRGDHHVKPSERFRMTTVARDPLTGDRIEDDALQLEVWGILVSWYKHGLIDRIQATPSTGFPGNESPIITPGGFYLTADILQHGEKYLKQLLNEPPTTVVNKLTGRRQTVFKIRSSKTGVDYWDTTVYSEAMADMVVGSMGWSAAAWKRWKQLTEQKRQTQNKKRKTNRDILPR